LPEHFFGPTINMKAHAQVAVIGGGVVGASVLYHLTKLGWRDVVLLERTELTTGSTWHAAGGVHTLNGDSNVASLQAYTINLYREIERVSGVSCGIHQTGCIYLAVTEKEYEFFQSECAKARHLKIDLDFIDFVEVRARNPLIQTSHYRAAMFDPNDGHVDPSGVTNAYAKAAGNGGAEIYRHTPVTAIRRLRGGEWELTTPNGAMRTEYVVNAAGLWVTSDDSTGPRSLHRRRFAPAQRLRAQGVAVQPGYTSQFFRWL